jgi:hypothetical protein
VNDTFANSAYDPIESYHHYKKHEREDSKVTSGKSLDCEVRAVEVSATVAVFGVSIDSFAGV